MRSLATLKGGDSVALDSWRWSLTVVVIVSTEVHLRSLELHLRLVHQREFIDSPVIFDVSLVLPLRIFDAKRSLVCSNFSNSFSLLVFFVISRSTQDALQELFDLQVHICCTINIIVDSIEYSS